MPGLSEPDPPFPPQELEKPGLERDLEPRPRYQASRYRPAGKLEGKVALVTGGDSGIGRAVAVLFAREGADVAFTYLPEERPDADETEQVLRSLDKEPLSMVLDVRDPKACKEAVGRVVRHFGRLDVLVNNAAYQAHQDDPEELSVEQWERTFRTNIDGYFFMARAALPHLEEGACIINSGSVTGTRGKKGLLDYASTKGAIHAFTKSLAQMLVDRGIRVNCVAPGPVWTPLNPADLEAEQVKAFGRKKPYERPAQPEEIAPAYVFFASTADSSYITGEVLTLTGGETRAG